MKDPQDYRSRRNMLKVLSTLGVAGLAGCSGDGDENEAGGGSTGGTTSGGETNSGDSSGTEASVEMADTITFWEVSDSWSGHIERYSEETGATIERTNMGYDEIIDRLQTRLLSGTGAPDVAMTEYSSLKQVADTGGLRDLSGWIEEAGIKGDFPEGVWQGVSTGDKIYEVPYDINPTNLFYRKDVWDEHGLDDSIETWDQLIEEGKKLPDDVALLSVPAAACDLYWRMLYRMQGGQAVDADGNIAFGNEKSLKVFETLQRLSEEGLADQTANWSQQWFAGFSDGTITGYCSGAWFNSTLRESVSDTAGNWRVMKIPAFEEGGNRVSNRGGSGLCIPKQVSEAKARRAFDFAVETCASEEEMASLFENVGNFPAYKPAYEDDAFDQEDEFFGGQNLGQMWTDWVSDIPSFRYTVDDPTIMDVINAELRKVVYDGADPQEALDRAVEEAANQTGRDVA